MAHLSYLSSILRNHLPTLFICWDAQHSLFLERFLRMEILFGECRLMTSYFENID